MQGSLPPTNNEAAGVVLDQPAVAKLIREELDRNNQYLAFAQSQIEQDRKSFRYLYTTAAGFLLVLVAVAGAFQYSSVNQMRSDMKASFEAELANVRTEVRQRVDKEFQSDNIRNIIATAAKERTNQEISGIIRSEVGKAIDDQTPAIQKAVAERTTEAVANLQPTIKATIESEMKDQVRESVEPITSKMEEFHAMLAIGNRTTLARGDDRASFDYLIQVALGHMPESENPELKKLADSTVYAIINEKKYGLRIGLSFKEEQTPEALKGFLSSSDRREREAALQNPKLPKDKSLIPLLLDIIKNDESIQVLSEASTVFNAITGQNFQFWQMDELVKWWEANKEKFSGG